MSHLDLKYSTGLTSIPLLQVRHKSIVVYPDQVNRRSRLFSKKPDFAGKKAYSGTVTDGVRKRLTKAINILLLTAKPKWKTNPFNGQLQWHRLSFLTLKITAAENLTPRQAYDSTLSYFLDWLTRTAKTSEGKDGIDQYVCKTELTIAGQIHYHITFPDMINLVEVRKKWNAILRKAGYLDDYAKEHGHYNANSTDIHSVNDIDNLSKYMVKAFTDSISEAEKMKKSRYTKKTTNIAAEFTKAVQNPIDADGKIWSCSELLAASHYVTFHMSTRHEYHIESLEREGRVKRVSDDSGYWAVLHFTDCSPPEIMNIDELTYIDDYLTWQMQRPTKSAPEDAFVQWAESRPVLTYKK